MRGRTGRVAGLLAVAAGLLLTGCATLPATGVRDRSAVLNGAVVGEPAEAAYRFQVAQRPADLGTVRGRTIDVASGGDPRTRSVVADGLDPDTDYVYRLCGTRADTGVSTCFGTQPFRTWTTHRAAVCPVPGVFVRTCESLFRVSNVTTTGTSVELGSFTLDEPHHGFLEAAPTAAGFGTAAAVRTPERALASGVVFLADRFEGLPDGARYVVRACVRRDADGDVVCTDPRALTTRYTTPTYPHRGGHVRILGGDGGDYGAGFDEANVDARAAADGSGATGGAAAYVSAVPGAPIVSVAGVVSCVDVDGSRAVVGVRSTDDPAQAQWTFFVQDNGGEGRDEVDGVPGRNADDCSPQRFGESTRRATLVEGRALVEPVAAPAPGT